MYLYILNGEQEGKRVELAPGIYTIGRAANSDIVLSGDNYVSGAHAELKLGEDDVLTLADKGSRNGTFLLGEAVSKPVVVQPGDIFQIGRTFFKITRRSQERVFVEGAEERAPEAIVVVDIAGSSKIAQMMGDSVAAKVKNTLKQSLKKNLETFPADYLKGTGDGYLIIFSKALVAVQFASGLLSDITREGDYKGFHIRIGINYGETSRLPDGDRRGSAVDMAFRVESVKMQDMHQTTIGIRRDDMPRVDRIFITETVQQFLANKPGITTRCIGFFELKGFNGRHKIFEVVI